MFSLTVLVVVAVVGACYYFRDGVGSKIAALDDSEVEADKKETSNDGRSEPKVASKEFTRKWLAVDVGRSARAGM